MRLYNTLTKAVEEFRPHKDDTVGLYVCGPTVYDHVHIGNVRPILVFDTLRRYMERFRGWKVIYVQNVTDIDDKLIQRSIETGESVEEIAKTYTDAYFALLDGLGVLLPTHSPLATEHVDGMISLIADLVEKGFGYEAGGDVYFRVAALPAYGKLSGRTLDDQEAGARVEASEQKESPLDFTLWKAAKPGEPKWPSPWGEGRPGWHTECVVLSYHYLDGHLDIHAGGNDLVFPHHENEIAQAEALRGEPFFRFWLHNGMLSFGGEKMSKSLGNFEYAYRVLDQFGADTVRYFYLSRHYRKPLSYSEDGLREAATALGRVTTLLDDVEAELRSMEPGEPGALGRQFVSSLEPVRKRFVEAMDDDLNTVGALGVIQELVAEANRFRRDATGADRLALGAALDLVRELGYPLGLFQSRRGDALPSLDADLIDLLSELRETLRSKKEFALADRIRDRLGELGIVLKDGHEGTLWTRER